MVEYEHWAYCFWETPQSLNDLYVFPKKKSIDDRF